MIFILEDLVKILKNDSPLKAKEDSPLAERLKDEEIFIDLIADQGWEKIAISKGAIDSRSVEKGDAFFCLKGERVDGHDFAPKAVDQGAGLIVAERDPFKDKRDKGEGKFPPVILVSSTLEALWKLAIAKRAVTKAKVIGITGTAGKTTLKEVLAQVLSSKGTTDKNHKNFNTQIGLPLSLINANPEAKYWVMEAGISQAHDMDELGAILQPDISVILNAGQGHIEGLKDEGVEAHKAKLALYNTEGGWAFANADYPKLIVAHGRNKKIHMKKKLNLVNFSTRIPCPFRVSFEGLDDKGKGLFKSQTGRTQGIYEAPFSGPYGAEHVAAIIAVATCLGMSKDEISTSLAKAELPDQRFQIKKIAQATIIDDSYNANPLSSFRMVEAAAELAKKDKAPLYLVMGDMLELGDEAGKAHEELGRKIATFKPSTVFWKGGMQAYVLAGLLEAGFDQDFFHVEDEKAFLKEAEKLKIENAVLLFKASRSVKLEDFVKAFTDKFQGN